jgi:hypothetical protein
MLFFPLIHELQGWDPFSVLGHPGIAFCCGWLNPACGFAFVGTGLQSCGLTAVFDGSHPLTDAHFLYLRRCYRGVSVITSMQHPSWRSSRCSSVSYIFARLDPFSRLKCHCDFSRKKTPLHPATMALLDPMIQYATLRKAEKSQDFTRKTRHGIL